MSHNSRIWAEIRRINEKIKDCKTAKTEIQTVRNSCVNKKEDWQTSYNGLAKNQELSDVKKKDVFEGEMAEGLKSKVADAMNQISSGLSKAETLGNSLDSQITKLENKISDLEAERRSLYNQLD